MRCCSLFPQRSCAVFRFRKVRQLAAARFWPAMRAGLVFVAQHRLLVTMACIVGGWQMCHHAALVVQILFATRTLGLSEGAVGLCFAGLGVGTIAASIGRQSHLAPPGSRADTGARCCNVWRRLVARRDCAGVHCSVSRHFAAMLMMFGVGAVLIFITFLAMRQAVTPAPLLGRMTSTMRWLILLPAGPGALLGGWLGEHYGLRSALVFAGGSALVLAALAWRQPVIRTTRVLPSLETLESALPGAA